MNKPAAIAAQLVDVRNVAAHKCVRLTVEVPAEQAMAVIEAFGWPTGVDPVPVAIARLDLSNARLNGHEPASLESPVEAAGLCGESPDRPLKARKPVAADKRMAQRAGILCADPVFQQFLLERGSVQSKNEPEAAEFIRQYCGIASRAELIPGEPPATVWTHLHSEFEAWRMI